MDSKKPDRRTMKTRRALAEALAELLAAKELHRITVQEIADTADVNRVTFYHNYQDVYDLYEKLEKEVVSVMEDLIRDCKGNPDYVKNLINYIDENRVYFSMMISPYSTATLGYKIGTMFDSTYLAICLERYNITENNTEFEYLCHYHVVGSLSIIEKWARGGYKEPKDLIVQGISDLEKGFRTFCDQKFGK
jgi:AcrR family transcriptional regulator